MSTDKVSTKYIKQLDRYEYYLSSIFFDLDQTLIYTPQNHTHKTLVRPGAIHCLKRAKKHFEVCVFTSACKEYGNAVINKLDPLAKYITYRLYRDACIQVGSSFIKDLRVIVNRKLENMLIVDDSCLSFGYQLDNGIPIRPWRGEPNDRELWDLTEYLQYLALAPDMLEANRNHFRLYSFCEDYKSRHWGKNRLKLNK